MRTWQNLASMESWNHRPIKRIQFCRLITAREKDIALKNRVGAGCSITKQALLFAVSSLIAEEAFETSSRSSSKPSLVMVLNEASSLLDEKWSKELHSGRYTYELSEETLYMVLHHFDGISGGNDITTK